MAERLIQGKFMRSEKVPTPDAPQPQTRNELQAWVREKLGLAAAVETALLNAIDAVFTRHERLWQESKHEAIQALSAGFADKMARVQTELTAKDATVSSISRYFEALVADLTDKSHRDPKTKLMNFGRFTEQLESFLALEQRGRWCAVGLVDITAASKTMDWEVELAAVIGRPAKNVSIEKALDYVAGYTICNDLSARDMGRRPHIGETSPFKADWTSHKSFDGSCPMGPWIVPASEIGDPHNLGMKLWVNDVIKQDSNSGQMIFNTNEQIAQLSSRITLHPGDVIMTGTPAGVGAARKEFLKAGDTVKLWIEKIGTLTNKMK